MLTAFTKVNKTSVTPKEICSVAIAHPALRTSPLEDRSDFIRDFLDGDGEEEGDSDSEESGSEESDLSSSEEIKPPKIAPKGLQRGRSVKKLSPAHPAQPKTKPQPQYPHQGGQASSLDWMMESELGKYGQPPQKAKPQPLYPPKGSKSPGLDWVLESELGGYSQPGQAQLKAKPQAQYPFKGSKGFGEEGSPTVAYPPSPSKFGGLVYPDQQKPPKYSAPYMPHSASQKKGPPSPPPSLYPVAKPGSASPPPKISSHIQPKSASISPPPKPSTPPLMTTLQKTTTKSEATGSPSPLSKSLSSSGSFAVPLSFPK